MIPDTLIAHGSQYISHVSANVGDLRGLIQTGEQFIQSHFGSNGVIAAYVVSGALGIAVASKLLRIAFAALIYLVVPAVTLAWIGSLVLPYSFFFLLPITGAAASLFFLFKA